MSLLVTLKERVPEEPEDVVDDALGVRNVGVAGPAGGLEASVAELVDQGIERHTVLQGERRFGADDIHQTADGRPFLRHRDEEFTGRVVLEQTDGDIPLMSTDVELVGQRLAGVGQAATDGLGRGGDSAAGRRSHPSSHSSRC